MAGMMPALLMGGDEAARLAGETLAGEHRLAPRRIDAGAHAGQYALPQRVLTDGHFAQHADAFAAMTAVPLDPVEAWPEPPASEETTGGGD